jgi:hypothetical protein
MPATSKEISHPGSANILDVEEQSKMYAIQLIMDGDEIYIIID